MLLEVSLEGVHGTLQRKNKRKFTTKTDTRDFIQKQTVQRQQ